MSFPQQSSSSLEQQPAEMVTCSVIVPTYNRAPWLPGCVESIRGSGLRALEIILVDDGSTDETRDLVAQLGADVRYYYLARAGESAARNHGVRQSRGRYVAFLDSDDRWLPSGHQALVELLDQHPEIAVGFGDALLGSTGSGYRSLSEVLGRRSFRPQTSRLLPGGFHVLDRQALFDLLARRLGTSISTFVIRRTALESLGGFDERLQRGSDWELELRLAARYTFVYSNRPLATYELHESNTSRSGDAEHQAGELLQVPLALLAGSFPLTRQQRASLWQALAQRLHLWGYAAFAGGDLRRARARFAKSLRLGGWRPLTLFYWACTWLSPTTLQRLRHAKRRLGR
jgi:glycosyltransferase involved in cell wall biosynthesis